jgi:hypothetical protein
VLILALLRFRYGIYARVLLLERIERKVRF